ncbi:Sorting nexin-2 [Chionoecetes opilio]|uniref:Sorting nexin-2 n=1 Tax=Chionoecetes opilio TaxID=41210 RepID=A0A8J4Y4Z7_CHIOP|nr:Sorting nexin-2 [Chionoecetes opilio]
MADSREPPPLFNEDREDDNDDLFTSAVQPDTSNDLFVSAVGPGVTESEGGHPELTSVPLDLPAGGEGEQQVSTVVQHLDLRPTSPCIASDLQPVTCTDPDTTDTKPTLGILFDLDTDPQPATCNLLDPQPVTLDPQPASYTDLDLDTDPQTATCNLLDPQPVTLDPQPASYTDLDLDTDPQTATCNLLDPQPVILDPQPASYTDLDLDTDPQTATCNLLDPQPASYTDLDLDTDPQPPTCNLLDSQPNTPEQQPQPATNLQEPTATTLMSDPTPLTPPILPHPCMALPQEQQAPPEALEAPSGTPPSPHEPSLAGQDKVAVTAPDPTLDLTSDPAFLHDPPSFLGETDTTEISLDEVVKTKPTFFPPTLQEVSLEEEADEPDIFDTMSSPKLQLNQDTSEPPVPPSSILPPMGAPLTPPVVPVTPTATPSLTPNITPAAPTPVSPVTVSRSSPDQVEGEGSDEYIQIGVSDPQKIGDGMSSYMAYKVTTKTNVSYFR